MRSSTTEDILYMRKFISCRIFCCIPLSYDLNAHHVEDVYSFAINYEILGSLPLISQGSPHQRREIEAEVDEVLNSRPHSPSQRSLKMRVEFYLPKSDLLTPGSSL